MAMYMNTKTSATIEANGIISGGNWVLASEYEEDTEKLTVPLIKEKLDSLGIEYDKKAQKAELLELLEAAESDKE